MVTQLRVERVKADIKQNQLASIVGIHFTMLSHYESGRRNCPPEMRQKLSKVLRVPENILFSKKLR